MSAFQVFSWAVAVGAVGLVIFFLYIVVREIHDDIWGRRRHR